MLEYERGAMARRRLNRLRPRLEVALRNRSSSAFRFGLTVGLDACLEQGPDREQHLEVLEHTARELSDHAESAFLRFRAARVEFLRGHWESALERVRALDPAVALPNDLAAEVQFIESACLRYLGEADRALSIADGALRASTSPVTQMRAHFHRAGALLMLERFEQVEPAARAALMLTLPLGAARQRALVLTLLSWHALAMDRPALACEYAAEAKGRFAALGDRLMVAKALAFLARSQLEHGDATARRTLSCAQRTAWSTGDRGVITNLVLLHAQHVRENAQVRLQECLWDNEHLGALALAQQVREALPLFDPDARHHLVIDRYRAFLVEGGSRCCIDLARHEKPRRVLHRLAQARLAGDGPLSVEALLVAAWPGERLVAMSGQNRVYAAIRFLRRAGLQSVLRSSCAGYELTCPVRLQD
jgi:tetratricopeptide (TPR) repeat protein